MSLQTIHLPFDVPLHAAKILSAGRLKCMYENGNLRYISWDGEEVIRMIYSAVRDENWTTARYIISDEVVEQDSAGFAVTYTATYEHNQIRYKADFLIKGNDDTISFSMKGVALNAFKSNRIGICVLHPIRECAGKNALIKQPDGGTYESLFPELISPHQPFKRIQQMSWAVKEGTQAELTFEGEVFETEDQRNWTDNSFKTYSRPLELPFPFDVHTGDVVEQRSTLKVFSDQSVSKQSDLSPYSSAEIKVPFPPIGCSRPQGFRHLTDQEISLFQKIPFNHYRVDLRMVGSDWKDELALAFSESKKLQLKLELVAFFGGENKDELKELVEILKHEQEYIKSILVLDKGGSVMPHEIFQSIYDVFKKALPGVKVGYGTDSFFAQLNRNRPQVAEYDFVSFSLNPQVHASDTRSVIENLSAQADAINTAQSFVADKAIYVSPVTFTKRSDDGRDVDARLQTSFGAWWTLQTLKNLSGAESITFYETVGAKGIIKEIEALDESQPADKILTPLYKVLAAITDFRPVFIIQNHENFVIENASGDRLMFVIDGLTSAFYPSP